MERWIVEAVRVCVEQRIADAWGVCGKIDADGGRVCVEQWIADAARVFACFACDIYTFVLYMVVHIIVA